MESVGVTVSNSTQKRICERNILMWEAGLIAIFVILGVGFSIIVSVAAYLIGSLLTEKKGTNGNSTQNT